MKKPFVLLALVIIGFSSFYLYYKEGTLPVNPQDLTSKIFVVRKGEGVSEIAKKLEKEDLIRNKLVFYLVIKRLGIDHQIQAGDFRLSPSMNVFTIAKSLTKGTLDVWITIIEGLRKEEIAQIVSRELSIPESEFIKLGKEGYLFPDTYLIPREATAEMILSILNKNFNRKYTADLRDKGREKQLTDEEVITLASLVEKEAQSDEDRLQVAAILLKRYKNDWPLQVDATIQYSLGYQPIEKTWWKKNLTKDELLIDSPYNSYKNVGLPPTPIANPGLASIQAVLDASEDTQYWYYLSDNKGKMHYAKTLEEHNENVKKYLR